MFDISMCKFDKCSKAQDCLRFVVMASKYQSYVYEMEKQCNEENGHEYFIEVKRLKAV